MWAALVQCGCINRSQLIVSVLAKSYFGCGILKLKCTLSKVCEEEWGLPITPERGNIESYLIIIIVIIMITYIYRFA